MHHAGGFGDPASLAPAPPPMPTSLKVAPANDFGFLSPKAISLAPANRAASLRNSAAAPAPRPAGTAVPATAAVQPADPADNLTLDNTLAAAQPIPYANDTFTITPILGRQAGGNLFYSFSAFSLSTGQTAKFTGTTANPVQNVLVRVTGGQASTIDGMLACTYPNADFFFINPAGVTFTANASLNLQGALALTTADYIGFADNTRFAATNAASGGTLSPTAPAAFGFLSSNPAAINVQATLSPAAGAALLVVGGNLQVTGALQSDGGDVTVVSAASTGEAKVVSNGLGTSAFSVLGNVVVSGGGSINASGDTNGGAVTVSAGSVSVQGLPEGPVVGGAILQHGQQR